MTAPRRRLDQPIRDAAVAMMVAPRLVCWLVVVVCCETIAVVVALELLHRWGLAPAVSLVRPMIVVGAGFSFILAALHIAMLRDASGRFPRRPGWANALTILRLVLVAPTVFLLYTRHLPAAATFYGVLVFTDIADGIVARRAGEITRFGVMLDPLADIISTAAVFLTLWKMDLVPVWLLAILLVRYGMLILGSVMYYVTLGPIEFRATTPGKVVAVLQALGVGAVLGLTMLGGGHLARAGSWLFPFLGACFASIVISQAVIGVRERRRLLGSSNKAVQFGSRR